MRDPPTAMKDSKGNLVTEPDLIKEMAINAHVVERLSSRPMTSELTELKNMKEKLCATRLKIAAHKKTRPWSLKDIDVVLKGLKKDKSRDPLSLANEIFRYEIVGDDLKQITQPRSDFK